MRRIHEKLFSGDSGEPETRAAGLSGADTGPKQGAGKEEPSAFPQVAYYVETDPYKKEEAEKDFGRPRKIGESCHGLPFQARKETDMRRNVKDRREFAFLFQSLPEFPTRSEPSTPAHLIQPFRFSKGP
jgi:hypothetical protein